MKNLFLKLAEFNTLETERLILRPVSLEDVNDFFDFASDNDTTFYMPRYKADNKVEALLIISNNIMKNPLGLYGIELKEERKFIGIVELLVRDEYSGEIGYILNKNYERKGYMNEAVSKLIKVGFEEIEFNRIFARFDVKNSKSGKLLEKVGMQKEGVLRHLAKNPKGEWKNRAYYSILKEEYEQQINSSLD